jgi:CHASE3 domain sensor protein
MSDEQEYVLGQDVTKAAASKAKSGTVMLSVRVAAEELAAVEAFANATGKTMSEVVREALRTCLRLARDTQPSITVSVQDGMTMSMGSPSVAVGSTYSAVIAGRELAPVA